MDQSFRFAAALVLVPIVIGGSTGLVVSGAGGATGMRLTSLTAEAGAIAALTLYARATGSGNPNYEGTMRRWLLVGGILVVVAAIITAVLLDPRVIDGRILSPSAGLPELTRQA